MRRQILCVGERDHVSGHLFESGLGVIHDVDTAQEGLYGQPAGMPCTSGGGEYVIGSGAVVAEAYWRPWPKEDRTGIA